MTSLLSWVDQGTWPIVLTLLGSLIALHTFMLAFLELRAQRRIHCELQALAKGDPELRFILSEAGRDEALSETQRYKVLEEVDIAIKRLNSQDQRLIKGGLEVPNRALAKAYLQRLLVD